MIGYGQSTKQPIDPQSAELIVWINLTFARVCVLTLILINYVAMLIFIKFNYISQAEIRSELNNLPLDCDVAHERKRIYQEKVGDDKRGYRRTFGIGVKTRTTGTSKQKATEAMLMVEAERQKRQALEDEIAAEKLKRIELENELVNQAEKRKELEQAVDSEKEKREALEDKVDKLSEIVLLMQGNGGQV